MSLPQPTFLFPSEAAMMAADVLALLNTPGLSVAITYKDRVVGTFVPSTGAAGKSYTSISTRAIRNEVPAHEVRNRPGVYKTGDLRFILARQAPALAGVTPSQEDQVVDGALIYDVVDWDSDPLNLLWRIVARQVS